MPRTSLQLHLHPEAENVQPQSTEPDACSSPRCEEHTGSPYCIAHDLDVGHVPVSGTPGDSGPTQFPSPPVV